MPIAVQARIPATRARIPRGMAAVGGQFRVGCGTVGGGRGVGGISRDEHNEAIFAIMVMNSWAIVSGYDGTVGGGEGGGGT